ncbi:Vitamin D3 receptorlike, partial [Caligus rogercresseyi]
ISASPLSIGLEFGELDTYLGNQGHFHVPTSGIGHYETTLQASTNNPLGASIDFPEMLRSNTFPLNEINYNIEDLNILSPIPNADTTVSSSSINNEGNSLMLKEEPKKRKRRPEPMTDVCRICGDIAPPHNHYGAIACFSCRAFLGEPAFAAYAGIRTSPAFAASPRPPAHTALSAAIGD